MVDGGRSTGPGESWDFFISYTAADQQWAEWIAWELENGGYRVLIEAWDFVAGSSRITLMSDGLQYATRVIAVVSESYLDSVYGASEWRAAFNSDPSGLARRLIPVRVEPCDPSGLLGQIVSIDLVGVDAERARRRLLAGIQGTIGGRSKPADVPFFPPADDWGAARGASTYGPTFPPAAEAELAEDLRSAPPARAGRRGQVWDVSDVFRPTGNPEVTFVQPTRFVQFRMSMRQPGLSIVLEGPSGVGKTTLLRHAIEQDTRRLGEPAVLSARTAEDRARIDAMIGGADHSGIVAIDDYHRLSGKQQERVVDYLKYLADTGDRDRKLVIVGIPDTARSLVQVSFDVANRIRAFRPGWATDQQVEELISKGERALNISFDDRQAIVRAAAGSLITAQTLCWHLLGPSRIEETVPDLLVVRTDIHQARLQVAEELELKYQDAVEAFASLDGSDETVCIELLLGLADSRDGILDLDRFALAGSAAASGAVGALAGGVGAAMAADATVGRVLYHDAGRRRLIADDPQFVFYIRQLNRERLVRDAGKRTPLPRSGTFVCYSHQDAAWMKRLQVHLSPLERDKLVSVWSDEKIRPGDDWRAEIDAALATARYAILLVSADFLASSFIREVELPRLLAAAEQGGCRVLPVLVRASAFAQTPELARFQYVNPGGRTLASLPAEDAEQVLNGLALALRNQIRLVGGRGAAE